MSGTITEHIRGFLGGDVVVFLQSLNFRAVLGQPGGYYMTTLGRLAKGEVHLAALSPAMVE